LFEKKFLQRVSPEKKIRAQVVSKKKKRSEREPVRPILYDISILKKFLNVAR